MELWLDALAIIVLSILIDRFIGDVPNSIHPLRWMGNLLDAIDRRIKNRSSGWTSVLGFLSYLLVFIVFGTIGLLIIAAVHFYVSQYDDMWGEIAWIIVTAFIFKIQYAIFSFRHHCDPICEDLDDGKVEDAAAKVQMIVSRNTKGMDAEHIASSCCETVSENLVDSIFSPTFFFGLFGITGSIMFRCANLMDAMWGYLNDKYSKLGFFPAKFDDVLGWLTSRISPYFIALAALLLGMDWRAAVPAAKAEHDCGGRCFGHLDGEEGCVRHGYRSAAYHQGCEEVYETCGTDVHTVHAHREFYPVRIAGDTHSALAGGTFPVHHINDELYCILTSEVAKWEH